jgi:2-polyprenyl-3-methyl-5-hydroxy-6-metoxy-1,4-benzoquinol methylase
MNEDTQHATQATTPQQQHGGPTPERIFLTLTGYQPAAALKAAIDLDIFSAIAEGDDTSEKLAARLPAAERGARILCDYLTTLQFLDKEGGRYRLTPESKLFLDRRSPAYVGGVSGFLSRPYMMEAFQNVAECVRRGGTTLEDQGTVTDENPIWEDFARSMAAMMRPSAQAIARITGAAGMEECKVLDVAAGHGVFGIHLLEQNPRSEVYAVDWHNVLQIARENAAAAGVASRYHLMPGSAFEVLFDDDYDLVLFTNFFHHFDPPTCEALMRKAHAALKPAGRAVTLEFVPNEDRVTPPAEAAFAMTMLASTPSGDAYTFSEFDRMFRNAGFARSEIHPSPPQHIIVSSKQ